MSQLAELVGTELGVSDWLTIDQDRINDFAETTIDHQFIHVDPDLAAQTPFGSTVAHGFLTLSLMTYLTSGLMPAPDNAVMGLNYGLNKVRFLTPVKVGSRVRARVSVADVTEKKPGRILITYDVVIEIEGEERPALVAQWLGMVVTA